MKAVIILRQDKSKWVESLGFNCHPAMVPICNKPLLEYIVDFMVLSQCASITINMEIPSREIQDYFGDGKRFGTCISYMAIDKEEGIGRIIEDNDIYSYCSSFPLIILDGLFFIHYDKSEFNADWTQALDTGVMASCNSGNLLIIPNVQNLRNLSRINPGIPFSLSKMKNIDDFVRINMEILEAEQEHYILPGYRQSQKINFGKNVGIGKNVKITPPVILGNNVRLQDDVRVGPHTVIGQNVILDEKSSVDRSMVLSNTYVGKDLEVSKKIIGGKKVINVQNKDILEVDDHSLFSDLPNTVSFSLVTAIRKLMKQLKGSINNFMPDFISSRFGGIS